MIERGIREARKHFIPPQDFDGYRSRIARSYGHGPNKTVRRLLSDTEHPGNNERSMAHLHPPPAIPALQAAAVEGLGNENTIIGQASPISSALEAESIAWVLQHLVPFDRVRASGNITTGGTRSNETALVIAQRRSLARGIEEAGVIFTSELAHYSLNKGATTIAGISGIETIPSVPGAYHMDPERLEEMLAKAKRNGLPVHAVVALAGATETGTFDPLKEIAAITKDYDVFLHVDAAYGGPYKLSERGHFLEGLELADSVTLDGHKFLFTGYNCGILVVKDSADHALITALNETGDSYLPGLNGNGGKRTGLSDHVGGNRLDGSLGGHSVARLHAVISNLGVDTLSILLNHTIDLTDYAAAMIRSDESPFELCYTPQINTVSFMPRNENHRVAALLEATSEKVKEQTGYWVSTDRLPVYTNGRTHVETVFRIVPSHPYTETGDIEAALGHIQTVFKHEADR